MKKIILVLAMVVVLSIFSFAVNAVGLDCDSGDLATTCTISSPQTITEDVSCNNLVINNNAVLTVDSINKVGGAGQIVITCAGDLTIDTGAKISAEGRGYSGGNVDQSGFGPGAGTGSSSYSGSGAGHASIGGASYLWDGTAEGGLTSGGSVYGSLSVPVSLGSGGGGGDSCSGSNGGGAIYLNVSGILDISGSISAAGSNRAACDSGDEGGAGSGGSIYIITDTLAGSGSISVNGGNAYGSNQGGGGSAGRAAIYYTSKTYTGSITAYGGTGYRDSGAGTIYLKSLAQNNFDLIVNNGANAAATSTSFDTSYTIDNMAVVNSIITFSEDLTIDANVLSCVGSSTLTITKINATSITIDSGSTITHPSASLSGLNITVANLTVESGGSIDVVGKGYDGGAMDQSGFGPGAGTGSSSYSGSGAGHASIGGASYLWDGTAEGGLTSGGSVYGSLSAPVSLGSGGGGGDFCSGSNGGGAIYLNVSGILDISGSISAAGSNRAACDSGDEGGAGSGGSIYIITDTLAGSGSISVNGGNAYGSNQGGGGSAGRAAIYYTSKTYTGSITAYGGTGYRDSGAGTIYLKSLAQNNFDLIVNNGANAAATSTSFDTSYTIDNMTVVNSIVTFSEDLTIDADIFSCTGPGTFIVTNLNATEIRIGSGSKLTHSSSSISGLRITATNVIIESGGSIDVVGKGYAGGAMDQSGFGPGAGTGSSSDSGSGAGHASIGGASYLWDGTAEGGLTSGGSVYGSLSAPVSLGSGGGGGDSCSGSNGGGAIYLNVSGILDISGSIFAAGSNRAACDSGDEGGAGSGGSVYIITDTLAGSGSISVNGGNAYGSNQGGGGSGGRIAIYSIDNTSFTGLITVSGGTGYRAGGDGTLYEENLPQPPVELSILNPIPSNNSVLPSGITNTILAISTTYNATCRYSNSSGELFSSMTKFSTTGETQHNSSIFGLQDAQGYDYYIKCQNISNLTDISDDYHTHFLVLDVLLEQCFPNQLGYWTFDHFNNNILYDIIGDNYATIYGGVTQSQPGQVGGGFEFDGEDGYLDVNGLEGVLPNATFGFWITPNQDYGFGSGQTASVILLKEGLTEIFIDTDGSLKETYNGTTIISSPAITWNLGQSHHILKTPNKFYLGFSSGCQISGPLSFSESNPGEIASGSSVNIGVDNGCPPFNWSVSGTGFSLATEIENNGTNTLYANSSACGAATITVTDILGQTATGYVFSTAGLCLTCENISIGYTTQQMSVEGVQTFTVEGAVSGTNYYWEITSGGGSLSSATGLSVDYTAPSTNTNCENNPNITLSIVGTVCDSLQLAVNAAGGVLAARLYQDVEISHTSFDECTQVSGTCTGCYITRFKMAKYSKILCDGSNMFYEDHYYSCGSENSCTYWSCVYCAAGEQCPGSCEGKCPYPSDSEIINNCIDQCGSVDVRTDLLKEQGCCPYQLLDG